ncbi:MAG TPA: acyl-CoA thioesterase [Thermoanaerobaculia bacterium]|jgi:acyl-CoA thioester hydrolase
MKVTVEVPYGDIDAMGHLNNVAYLRYLEWARSKYWLAMRGTDDFWKLDFVVARSEIDYRAASHMGEILTIDVRVSRVGNASFDFSYRVTGADGRLVAEAKTTQVCYDWETRRSKPLSEERRREIERFEAGSPAR